MNPARNTLTGSDGHKRCWWCGTDPLYIDYHDNEWGVPVFDDRRLFEKICLEGFQAGLSWITILRKRENFRAAFSDFDFEVVAKFGKRQIDRLMRDAGIVRNRAKIEATINNAHRVIELIETGGSFSDFLWQFQSEKSPTIRRRQQIPAVTEQSKQMSKTLRKMGWKFVGPTTCYALMQTMGMVNDHLRTCHAWTRIEWLRKEHSS